MKYCVSLVILLLLVILSCHVERKPTEKADTKRAKPVKMPTTVLDTTKMLVDWYNYFVSKKRKVDKGQIEMIALETPIPDNGKGYFSFAEVQNYYHAQGLVLEAQLLKSNEELRNKSYKETVTFLEFIEHKPPAYNHLVFFYYNPKYCKDRAYDFMEEVACIEELEERAWNEHYGTGEGIKNLVFSANYKSDSTCYIPGTMQVVIKSAFEDVVKLIPDTVREKYKHTMPVLVEFESGGDVYLGLKSGNRIIYMSTLLARAAFFASINKRLHIMKMFLAYEKDYSRFVRDIDRTEADDRAMNQMLLNDFIRSFQFVFLHEIGHYVLKKNHSVAGEIACDCYAHKNMPDEWWAGLGIFETLLVNSVENNYYHLWGQGSDQRNILLRHQRLVYLKDNPSATCP